MKNYKTAQSGFIALLLLTFTFVHAQQHTPHWQWAKVPSDTGLVYQEGLLDASDPDGNVFVTGFFSNTMTVDTIHLSAPQGGQSLFVVKYSPSGQVLWAHDAPTAVSGAVGPTAITTDSRGNVFIAGVFGQAPLTFESTVLPTPSSYDNFFLAKYDAAGHFQWVRQGGPEENRALAIVADNAGNAYLSGNFRSDSFNLGSTTLYSGGGMNNNAFFAVKYDTHGNMIWARGAAGDTSSNSSNAIVADRDGYIYITGFFLSDSIRFGSHTIDTHDPVVTDLHSFLTKYDTAGNVIWAKQAGGAYMSSDMNGNLYITNWFTGASYTVGTTTLHSQNPGQNAFYIAKLDTSGAALWAKLIGTDIQPASIAANDTTGTIYVTGPWINLNASSVIVDGTVLTQPPFSGDPIFILSYDTIGTILCGATLSSGGDDLNSVCTDPAGNAFLTGDFLSDGSHPFIVGADTFPWAAHTTGAEKLYTAKFNCERKNATGIQDESPVVLLSLYPTPASHQVTMRYALQAETIENTLLIYNMTGQKIGEYKLDHPTGELTINCRGISSGVYICSLISDGKTVATRKMVIQQ